MDIDASGLKQPPGRNQGLNGQNSVNQSRGTNGRRFGTQSVVEPSESDKE